MLNPTSSKSTAALIAWPLLFPTLWLLALLAEVGQANYMALNCPVSSFAAAKIAVANVMYAWPATLWPAISLLPAIPPSQPASVTISGFSYD